ncbi:MAG: hypothetical protein ACREKM_03255, partial [Longimicrobiales bacterium]
MPESGEDPDFFALLRAFFRSTPPCAPDRVCTLVDLWATLMKDTRKKGAVRTFAAMLPYARPYAWGIAAGMALIVVADGFGALVPWM